MAATPDGFSVARRDRLRPEEAINAIAAEQHGLVTRRQLLSANVSPDVVDRRLSAGSLRAVHRGVYQVGPTEAPRAREMAAVLACGSKALVSHWSAAALWGVLPASGRKTCVHVLLSEGCCQRPGIQVHRIRTVRPEEVTRFEGIPITTPARTLFDLAGTVDRRALERAVAEGLARRLTSTDELRGLLARHRGGRGSGRLRTLLEAGQPARTRSEAERRFLELIRKAALESPEVNVEVAGYEVDFLWRAGGLVVEVDGYAYHSTRRAFEGDRRRGAVLMAAGLRVMRVTWRQLVEEPFAVVALLAQALARGRSTAAPSAGERGPAGP